MGDSGKYRSLRSGLVAALLRIRVEVEAFVSLHMEGATIGDSYVERILEGADLVSP